MKTLVRYEYTCADPWVKKSIEEYIKLYGAITNISPSDSAAGAIVLTFSVDSVTERRLFISAAIPFMYLIEKIAVKNDR